MTRNSLTVAFLLLLALNAPAPAAAAESRPNFVLFFADDWGRHAGCYADPAHPSLNDLVRTPHIDRVAQNGVRFTRAFYPSPQCTPSRGALLTGCYFWRCGSQAFLHSGDWSGHRDPFLALPHFPALLAESGYETAKAYKTINFTPTLAQASTDSLQDYLRYGLHLSAAQTPEERERRRAEVIAQTRESIVRVLQACPPEKPFFFIFGPINSHRPYAVGSGQALWGIQPDSLKGRLPAYLPDVPEVRTDLADYLGEVQALDLMVGIFTEELEKSGRLQNTVLVLTGDNGTPGVPHGKTQMYDLGSHAPLIVSWPDRIPPGRAVDDFVNLMDLGPTFLEFAGLTPPAAMDGMSLARQLLAKESGTIQPERDHAIFGRERHFTAARPGNLPYPSRAIRSGTHLYIRNFKPERWPWGDPFGLDGDDAGERGFETWSAYGALRQSPFRDMDNSLTKAWIISHRKDPLAGRFYEATFGRRPAEELYDLSRDPDQVQNLAALPESRETLQRLSSQLTRVLKKTGDPRRDDSMDRPPYVQVNPKADGAPQAHTPARGAR